MLLYFFTLFSVPLQLFLLVQELSEAAAQFLFIMQEPPATTLEAVQSLLLLHGLDVSAFLQVVFWDPHVSKDLHVIFKSRFWSDEIPDLLKKKMDKGKPRIRVYILFESKMTTT
jgi:hypothetical protein